MNTAAQARCSTTEISAPTRAFRLIPAGHFQALDGRPGNGGTWYLNKAAALKIIEASASRASDFVIDYEHQSLADNGNPAPAAGWFHKLEWRDDGLHVVDARWTDKAARMILAREYRYISPVFTFDKTGNVLGIVNCALTNTPALDGLTELAAARLTDPQLVVCKQMGVKPEDFAKTLRGTQTYGLTNSQLAVCKGMGVKPEDFAKTLAAQAAYGR
jgi:phage I-like protein